MGVAHLVEGVVMNFRGVPYICDSYLFGYKSHNQATVDRDEVNKTT
jgi:hypothetical protein